MLVALDQNLGLLVFLLRELLALSLQLDLTGLSFEG